MLNGSVDSGVGWNSVSLPDRRKRESHYDIAVVGGGTAGAALAGLLARHRDRHVALIEAGPDFGGLSEGRWPESFLDARRIPYDVHDWGYTGLAHAMQTDPIAFDRAKLIGGCSSHNGCIALLGHYRDYDHWSNLGNPGWSWGSVRPSFERAMRGLRVRQVDDEEITPFQRLFMGGAVAAGLPRVPDLNNPSEIEGVAPAPVNIHDGTRWNTALGYLDPVRAQGNLTIIADAIVDTVEFDGDRATGVTFLVDDRRRSLTADRIVLSAGAYGSPAILQRSGVGPAELLRRVDVEVRRDLSGVGARLTDHPAVALTYRGSNELDALMDRFEDESWLPDEQVLAKARSSLCTDAFDLHLYAVSGRDEDTGGRTYTVHVACVAPMSDGHLRISSSDPHAALEIDHGYLTDPEGHDARVMLDGIALAREAMRSAIDAGLLLEEMTPGVAVTTRDDLQAHLYRSIGIYYHPACSCRMGPSPERGAVVDSLGRVHGFDNLWVCDASIFPTLMRANTNLPSVMVAEHLAPVIAAGP
jgi:choline dehydrogenase